MRIEKTVLAGNMDPNDGHTHDTLALARDYAERLRQALDAAFPNATTLIQVRPEMSGSPERATITVEGEEDPRAAELAVLAIEDEVFQATDWERFVAE